MHQGGNEQEEATDFWIPHAHANKGRTERSCCKAQEGPQGYLPSKYEEEWPQEVNNTSASSGSFQLHTLHRHMLFLRLLLLLQVAACCNTFQVLVIARGGDAYGHNIRQGHVLDHTFIDNSRRSNKRCCTKQPFITMLSGLQGMVVIRGVPHNPPSH